MRGRLAELLRIDDQHVAPRGPLAAEDFAGAHRVDGFAAGRIAVGAGAAAGARFELDLGGAVLVGGHAGALLLLDEASHCGVELRCPRRAGGRLSRLPRG
ncbi:MAG: hypothetical protein U1F49_02205 [Rubrivivax sp.]